VNSISTATSASLKVKARPGYLSKSRRDRTEDLDAQRKASQLSGGRGTPSEHAISTGRPRRPKTDLSVIGRERCQVSDRAPRPAIASSRRVSCSGLFKYSAVPPAASKIKLQAEKASCASRMKGAVSRRSARR